MYLGAIPSSPAWDAVTRLGPSALRSQAAVPLIQAAVREAAVIRRDATAAGDFATLATANDRLARLAGYQAMATGVATGADIMEVAQSAAAESAGFLPAVGGMVKTIVWVGVAAAAAFYLLPQLGKAVGESRGVRRF